MMRKLARSQMRLWTRQQLAKQEGLCPLCALPIDLSIPRQAVVDHDHETGEVRAVLCRSCNACEGKVKNAVGRWGTKKVQMSLIVPYLERLLTYYKQPGLGVIYAQHQTPEEKKQAELAKRRRARVNKAAHKRVRSMAPNSTAE